VFDNLKRSNQRVMLQLLTGTLTDKLILLDPETGLQALRTLFLLLLVLFSVLRLFHFTTDRRQTSHTHC